MKILIFLYCVFLPFMNILTGLDVITTPQAPVKKDSGKILKLTEVLLIRDSGGNYYFKYPQNLKISIKGTLFISDDNQLLKFNPDGKFCTNFFNKGQGPMEVTYIENYLLEDSQLIIYDSGQKKIVFIDHEKQVPLKEFKVDASEFSYTTLFYTYNKKLYFLKRNIPETAGKLEILDVDHQLISIPMTGGKIETMNFSIPQKYFNIRAGDRYFTYEYSQLLTCQSMDDYLFISHLPNYGIKFYSKKKGSVLREVSRKYNPVKVTAEFKKYAPGGNFGRISLGGGESFRVPVAEYFPDIQALYSYKGHLWVITSTLKNGNAVLVDVYNEAGQYVDNFYIQCPPGIIPYRIKDWIQTINGDFLYTVEEDSEGNRLIKKYKIEGWQ